MDTLPFEPQSFHKPRVRRLFGDREPPRIDQMNLSELEVFMLRGRPQAQIIGGARRQAFTKLCRLLRGPDGDAGSRQRRHHRHA